MPHSLDSGLKPDPQKVLHRFGFSVTPDESGEMIKFADGKKSGHIDLEDFTSFCRLRATPI